MLKMEKSDAAASPATTTTTTTSPALSPRSQSPSASPPPQPQQPPIVLSPCAACKILRRRCAEKCVLAPYFPPTEPTKFTIAHHVFGASNIIKFLQNLPECKRADAVSSMVYEANARIRDPVYGCAGAIWQLQRQLSDVQMELATAQAELLNMRIQQANLLAMLSDNSTNSVDTTSFVSNSPQSNDSHNNDMTSLFQHHHQSHHATATHPVSLWDEPLWI